METLEHSKGNVELVLSAFKMREKLSNIRASYSIYRVSNLRVVGEERYRILNDLARKISNEHHCIAVRYTPTEDLNGVVVFGASSLSNNSL